MAAVVFAHKYSVLAMGLIILSLASPEQVEEELSSMSVKALASSRFLYLRKN
jgi:hypothetical protein